LGLVQPAIHVSSAIQYKYNTIQYIFCSIVKHNTICMCKWVRVRMDSTLIFYTQQVERWQHSISTITEPRLQGYARIILVWNSQVLEILWCFVLTAVLLYFVLFCLLLYCITYIGLSWILQYIALYCVVLYCIALSCYALRCHQFSDNNITQQCNEYEPSTRYSWFAITTQYNVMWFLY